MTGAANSALNDSEPGIPPESKHLEILADGTMIAVKLCGGSREAREEIVKVWKLGMAEMPILGAAMGSESKEIAAVTRKDLAWVEQLDDDSFEALIEEGRRLNFTRFSKYWKRQTDLLKAMGQGNNLDRAVERAMDKLLETFPALEKSSNT